MGDEFWMDPTSEETRVSHGALTLACMPALGVVTNVWQTGQMPPKAVIEVC